MGNALTNPTAKAHARALLWDEESVPDNAWVISIWLEVNLNTNLGGSEVLLLATSAISTIPFL
jgi:hypothetical protein